MGGGREYEGDFESWEESVPLLRGMTGNRLPLLGGFGVSSALSLRLILARDLVGTK